MPIFDYKCPECKYVKELLVMSTDTVSDPQECRFCKTEMFKAPSAPGLLVTNGVDKPSPKAR